MDWQAQRYPLDINEIDAYLSDIDEKILDCLTYRACTPCVIRHRLSEGYDMDKSRQHISNRLRRMERDLGLVENLYDCGEYELITE